MSFSHWLVDENRGVSSETPEKQQVSMMIDGINQSPAPHFLPKGHYWRQVKIVQSIYQVHYKQTVARLVGA
jgi:hypothetical protein